MITPEHFHEFKMASKMAVIFHRTPTKLQENVLCWFSGLSVLENNILKVLKKWTTRSGSILTFKNDGHQCKMNADFFKYTYFCLLAFNNSQLLQLQIQL